MARYRRRRRYRRNGNGKKFLTAKRKYGLSIALGTTALMIFMPQVREYIEASIGQFGGQS